MCHTFHLDSLTTLGLQCQTSLRSYHLSLLIYPSSLIPYHYTLVTFKKFRWRFLSLLLLSQAKVKSSPRPKTGVWQMPRNPQNFVMAFFFDSPCSWAFPDNHHVSVSSPKIKGVHFFFSNWPAWEDAIPGHRQEDHCRADPGPPLPCSVCRSFWWTRLSSIWPNIWGLWYLSARVER